VGVVEGTCYGRWPRVSVNDGGRERSRVPFKTSTGPRIKPSTRERGTFDAYLLALVAQVDDVRRRCEDGHVLQHLRPGEPDLRAPKQAKPVARGGCVANEGWR